MCLMSMEVQDEEGGVAEASEVLLASDEYGLIVKWKTLTTVEKRIVGEKFSFVHHRTGERRGERDIKGKDREGLAVILSCRKYELTVMLQRLGICNLN